MFQIHTLVVGRLETNCYILQSGSSGLVIDPGDEGERIIRFLIDTGVKPRQIVATHAHFDHILGVDVVRKKFGAEFLIHRDDLSILESMQAGVRQFMGFEAPPPPKVEGYLKDGEVLKVGDESVTVLHTPGHSPGSLSLYGKGFVFTGDALFNGSIGRTDLPGGDMKTLMHSITEKLFRLDDKTVVYPGHGPESSIGDEKLANPFVGRKSKLALKSSVSPS